MPARIDALGPLAPDESPDRREKQFPALPPHPSASLDAAHRARLFPGLCLCLVCVWTSHSLEAVQLC